MISSDEFFQTLEKEQQEIIRQAAQNAQEEARESADTRQGERQKQLEEEGMEIISVDETTWQEMRQVCQPVYENIREQAGEELFDLYMGTDE